MSEAITHSFFDVDGIKSPLLIDLPHSGGIYPADFHYSCPKIALELCEEKYLDELLIPPALSIGGAVLKANFPRTYVDVNRDANDIDQLLLATPWTGPICDNGRAVHGHGVVMRLVQGEPIYRAPLAHIEIENRIKNYYSEYHKTLNDLSNKIVEQFGTVYHLNLHSMPSSVVKANFPHDPPDFILGDLDGRSCGLNFRNHISGTLKDMGYRVVINQLYKGAEIIRRYGQPAWGRHSLQVEINRALFQDEKTGKKNNKIDKLKEDIESLIRTINALS